MVFSVASLLIQLRPGEKRQRGRWRPGWGHQEGPGRGFLFLLAKMSQDSVDDVLIFNATVRRSDDDFQRPATATADLNIDGKNAFQWCVTRRWAQVIAA
jgi:hypothetical protein